MIMLRKLMVAATLTLGASGAFAQEAGWYGGLDVGGSHLSESTSATRSTRATPPST
jgi:hypothetical protein